MEEPLFRLGVKHLEKLVHWKTRKDDEMLPSKKRRTSSRGGTPPKDGSCPTSARIIMMMRAIETTRRRRTATRTRPVWINCLVHALLFCFIGLALHIAECFFPPTVHVYNGTMRGQCRHQPACQHAWLTLGTVAVKPVKAHTAGPCCHNKSKDQSTPRGGALCGPSVASAAISGVDCCILSATVICCDMRCQTMPCVLRGAPTR